MKNRRHSRGQVWYTDFVVATLIFATILVAYFAYTEYTNNYNEDVLEDMILDSKYVTSSLMSGGYPPDWTKDTVLRIGITDNNYRINSTKLGQLVDMDYEETRKYFRTYYNYYFFIEHLNGTRVMLGTKNYTGREPQDPDFLLQSTRMALNESEIMKIGLYLWR